ncbi:MAG: hypothetical protein U0T68_12280 [Ferruginibacter sp.]
MKKLLIAILQLLPVFAVTQNVGVGTNSPEASASLHIKSSSKGLLIPHMSDLQMRAIASPAKGLLIFHTTGSSFYIRESQRSNETGR